MADLFGFEIKRKTDKQTIEKPSVKTFVADTEADGAGVIKAGEIGRASCRERV